MKGVRVGSRNTLVQRSRLLLFDDRVEEVSDSVLSLKVRRLFFDEAQSVTVHRTYGSLIVALLLFGLIALVMLALLVRGLRGPELLAPGIPLAIIALVLAVHLAWPTHVLKLRAPGQVFQAQLEIIPSRRERVVRQVVESIARYQREHVTGAEDVAAPSGSQ